MAGFGAQWCCHRGSVERAQLRALVIWCQAHCYPEDGGATLRLLQWLRREEGRVDAAP